MTDSPANATASTKTKRPTQVNVSPEIVNSILKSRFGDGLTHKSNAEKHGVSQLTITTVIKQFGDDYVKKFGATAKPARTITKDDMTKYWDEKK